MNTSNRQRTDTEDSRTDHASASGCCGGPAPVGTSACCAEDAVVKATGGTGCGCGAPPQREGPRSHPAAPRECGEPRRAGTVHGRWPLAPCRDVTPCAVRSQVV